MTFGEIELGDGSGNRNTGAKPLAAAFSEEDVDDGNLAEQSPGLRRIQC
jgi:hypothetical protein